LRHGDDDNDDAMQSKSKVQDMSEVPRRQIFHDNADEEVVAWWWVVEAAERGRN
jgi:hypothetical protein